MLRSREILAIASILVGCAHSGPRFELRQAREKDAAVVYLYRLSRFTGAAVHPDVIIDGVPWGTIDNGGYARFELPAGRHMLKVETRKDLNHGAAWLELEKGGEYFYKYILDHGFSWGANVANSLGMQFGAVGGAASAAASDDVGNQESEPQLYLESGSREVALQEIAETTLIEPAAPR